MNKEVIYLEPEDDITDILTKLQRAEQKLVALVPPKKATMLRSAVNMKLVARAAKECKKVAVIVTADPAIIKLAMAARIPVAKTLQSRPMVPTPESVKDASQSEQVIDEDLTESTAEKAELGELKDKKKSSDLPGEASSKAEESRKDKNAHTFDLSEESLENDSKGPKNSRKKGEKTSKGEKLAGIAKYRKWIAVGAVALVALIIVGVWAFVFAPAVNITVAMNTSASNFSEEVRFTTDKNAATPETGLLYAEKRTFEENYNGEFTATGREDRGERATGTVRVQITARFVPSEHENGYSYTLTANSTLVATNADGYSVKFITDEAVTLTWDGNTSTSGACKASSCTLSKTENINVTAEKAGEDYNIGSGRTWNSIESNANNAAVSVAVSNTNAFTGGTTHEVTFVSQEDLDKAKEAILSNNQIEGKSQLFSQIRASDQYIIIESSFASESGEVTSKPEVNAEVSSGTTPEATVKAIYSVYVISRTDVEEYIKAKTSLSDDQRIYSIGEPYIERFTSIEEAARLKTVMKTGPTVTEENILEKAKGRKIGEVQSLLRSINGVSSVTITPSYFWVWSVPTDPAKVTIDLTVEDN